MLEEHLRLVQANVQANGAALPSVSFFASANLLSVSFFASANLLSTSFFRSSTDR